MIKLFGSPETKDMTVEISNTDNCKLAYIECNDNLEVECTRDNLREFAEGIIKELDKLEGNKPTTKWNQKDVFEKYGDVPYF